MDTGAYILDNQSQGLALVSCMPPHYRWEGPCLESKSHFLDRQRVQQAWWKVCYTVEYIVRWEE